MRVKRFENSIFSSNSYVLDDSVNAVIIDIGDFKPILEYLGEESLVPIALFITHTHYDHVYGIREVIKEFPKIPIYTSEFGKEALNKPNWNFSRYHNDEISIESDKIISLKDGETLMIFKNLDLQVIATPGHDKSCLTFKIGDMLFTGDSYIPGIKVVASFPNSNKAYANYWYDKLESMSSSHSILPGHGDLYNYKET